MQHRTNKPIFYIDSSLLRSWHTRDCWFRRDWAAQLPLPLRLLADLERQSHRRVPRSSMLMLFRGCGCLRPVAGARQELRALGSRATAGRAASKELDGLLRRGATLGAKLAAANPAVAWVRLLYL